MNVERIVDLLGLETVKPKGKGLSARCPLHDDRNPSFSINSETGAWICYSGCSSAPPTPWSGCTGPSTVGALF